MGIKLQCTPWMYGKKRTNINLNGFFFFQLLLSLPMISLVYLIIIFDFKYNILIITILNTSTKSFLCKIQKVKFVFLIVKLVLALYNYTLGHKMCYPLEMPSIKFWRQYLFRVLFRVMWLTKSSTTLMQLRTVGTIPIQLYTVLINNMFIILKMLIITTQTNVYIITKK